ncbi:MAG: hypothetical protein JF603_09795 [Acidobacteria bacterium]|nr:hypothetical protein [Acidobacteriota bacterium]
MVRDRYVLLGLARPRAEWFRAVAQWATSAAIPAEFLKCVSVAELLARLETGRPHSAALIDASLPGLDRDLVDAARRAGVAVLVVGETRTDWLTLGASAVLPPTLRREVLLDALASHASLVGGVDIGTDSGLSEALNETGLGALVVSVCGPGGTGASITAAALAQGMAADMPDHSVLLADLALHADQAMLHDVRDVVPGVQELVEAHRSGQLGDDEVRGLTFEVVDRGYDLLIGLRRARHWASLRPRAFDAGFAALCRAYDVVVCDVDPDIEGDEIGTPDVAERHLLARTATAASDVVIVVGRPTAKGVHSLVRTLADLADGGVAAARLLPVVVDAPRSPRARAGLASAVAQLGGSAARATAPLLFLPGRRVDDAVRDGLPMPAPLPGLLARAVRATASRSGPVLAAGRDPVLVQPGSLGL